MFVLCSFVCVICLISFKLVLMYSCGSDRSKRSLHSCQSSDYIKILLPCIENIQFFYLNYPFLLYPPSFPYNKGSQPLLYILIILGDSFLILELQKFQFPVSGSKYTPLSCFYWAVMNLDTIHGAALC